MPTTMSADRYDRQQRIQGWNQTALAQARVLVAGAGALGNEVIKNLALLGVGQLLIVDFDHIEASNLSRTVLFQDSDVGRPKAQVAVERSAQLNPAVDLRYINGDLFYDLGLGFYRHCDLVVGGLDSLAVRSQVGLCCALAGIPFLDGGMWALGGEVRWFAAGAGPCFECTLSPADRQRAFIRRSCTGFHNALFADPTPQMPTTVSTAAIIGGMLAQEAVRFLSRWTTPMGQAIVYNGQMLTLHQATLPRDPACPYHTPYTDVTQLAASAAILTVRELLTHATADTGTMAPLLSLGRDFITAFLCPQCSRQEEVNRLMSQVEESRLPCPHCGATRQATIVSYVDPTSLYLDRPLCELGIPPGEVLAVRCGEALRFYELTADINTFWSG